MPRFEDYYGGDIDFADSERCNKAAATMLNELAERIDYIMGNTEHVQERDYVTLADKQSFLCPHGLDDCKKCSK